MRAPHTHRGTVAAALSIALAVACGTDKAPGTAHPHVVLLSLDTLRADHLGCYGYERATSPRMDALAKEGALFEEAFSPSSWTLPAHMTLLTGLPVSIHGACDDRLWTRVDSEGAVLPVPLRGTFVPEHLRAAGYATAGFYSWKYLEPQFGFGPGFDRYERLGHTFYSHPVVGPLVEAAMAARDEDEFRRLQSAYPDLFEDGRPTAPEVVDQGLAWLREQQQIDDGRPLFLFLHLFDIHDPYTPPPPFDRKFDPDYSGPIDGRRITSPDSPIRRDMDPRDLEHLIALYDGGIAWVDSEVGRFLDGLEDLGISKDTLVILVSDHGEEFFEHGQKAHRRQLYRESVHVPLIIRWPGNLPANRHVAGPVGLLDIAPTILAASGLPAPESWMGRDLLKLVRDGGRGTGTYLSELFLFDGDAAPERHLGMHSPGRHDILRARGTAPHEVETFDLIVNPHERGHGVTTGPDAALSPEIADRLNGLRSSFASRRAVTPRRSEVHAQLDAVDLAELGALGYTGLEAPPGSSPHDAERLCLDGCVWPDE
jgi:arylsulfatase A-like enzyme